MSALPKRHFSPAEYLELEVKAPYRSQYVAGEIFAMAGAQPWHIEVVDNLTAALRTRFRGKPSKSYATEMRVQVESADLWTYPDVVALCGPSLFDRTNNPPSLLNPQVIFEVLSPSTEAFDRGEKFERYRSLASLVDYVLVVSERMRVEHHTRQENGAWMVAEYDRPEHRLPLRCVHCELPLQEIYDEVAFPFDR